MDFALTMAQLALRDRVIEFSRAELGRHAMEDDRESRFPMEDWHRCAEFGVLGWPVPQEFGGSGLDWLTTVVALEALGYGSADNGLVFAVNNHLWGSTIYLLVHGSEQQKRRFLPAMCLGTLIGAQAISEPEVGSDVLSMRASAVREGDHYRLSGTKWFVSNGPIADVLIVLARTGDAGRRQDALSTFVVPADIPGVHKPRAFDKCGLRSNPMGVVEFDGCAVPVDNLLGREGSGYSIFASTIEWERTFTFASQVGTMERMLDRSIAYATSRPQFGRPIGAFQAVAHRIADMKIRLELARLILYRVGWLKTEGRIAALDSAIAKTYISESVARAAMATVDIHGARGYLTEWGIERELRDAIGGRIYAGTSDIQRGIIAELLGLNGALSGTDMAGSGAAAGGTP